jgi:hypothetical protein
VLLRTPEYSKRNVIRGWVFLLDIYGKDKKDDLGREEKKVLASLASRIKEAAKGRSKGG